MGGGTVRIDIDRLVSRIEALGEIGAVSGPDGERGCARLALTDADRAGRDLVVTWMHDLGLDVRIDAIGNVVAHAAWERSHAGARDDRLAHRHGSHRRTLRREPRGAGRTRGARDVAHTRHHDRRAACRWRSSPTRRGPDSPPTCSASLVYVGGMALEEALDVAAVDDGARRGRAGAHRLRRAGAVPGGCVPHAYVELHIEQGPVLEEEGTKIGVVDGRAGDHVDRAHDHRSVGARRHDADAHAA